MSSSVLGLGVGFVVLGLLLALRRPVWLALLASSLAMGLVGAGPLGFARVLAETSGSSIAVDLVVITLLIAVFVDLYRSSGFLDRLGDELVRLLRRPRLIAMLVPAVLGLLPVAGGALMSAPIVDTVGNHMGLSRRLRLFVNVWFRHVIFLVYPLSTVLITAAALAGVDMWGMIARQLPVMLVMVLAGYVLGFRGSRSTGAVEGGGDRAVLLRVFSPMLLAIALAIATRPVLDRELLPIPLTRYSMVLGISSAIALLAALSRRGVRGVAKGFASRQTWELVTAAYSAILLRNLFVSLGGPQLLSSAVGSGGGLGAVALMVAVPAAISLATGSPMTGNVVALSVFQPALGVGLGEASLIYTSAMVGYLASPAHLCYVYTAQYFRIPMSSAYREMFLASVATLGAALVIYAAWPA